MHKQKKQTKIDHAAEIEKSGQAEKCPNPPIEDAVDPEALEQLLAQSKLLSDELLSDEQDCTELAPPKEPEKKPSEGAHEDPMQSPFHMDVPIEAQEQETHIGRVKKEIDAYMAKKKPKRAPVRSHSKNDDQKKPLLPNRSAMKNQLLGKEAFRMDVEQEKEANKRPNGFKWEQSVKKDLDVHDGKKIVQKVTSRKSLPSKRTRTKNEGMNAFPIDSKKQKTVRAQKKPSPEKLSSLMNKDPNKPESRPCKNIAMDIPRITIDVPEDFDMALEKGKVTHGMTLKTALASKSNLKWTLKLD